MVSSLGNLPEEVLHSILCCCDPVSSAALGQTARRLRSVSNESLLWRFYCLKYFQYWDHSHDLQENLHRPAALVNWKALYISRHRVDRATTRLLDSILSSQTGRLKKVRMIIHFGYDIKDTLLHHAAAGSEVDDYLARRSAPQITICYHILSPTIYFLLHIAAVSLTV
jgi:F-box protein 21